MTKFSKIYRPVLYATLAGTINAKSLQSINHSFTSAGRDLLAVTLTSNDLANVLSHGCWCQKLDPNSDHDFLGGHSAVDDLDAICKQWFTARRCNENHEGGSCVDYNQSNNSGFYQINGEKCSKNDNNDCEQDTCKIDMEYASRVKNFLNTAGNWNSVTPNDCPVNHNGMAGVTKYCVGDAPNVYLSNEKPEETTTTEAPTTTKKEVVDAGSVQATCADKQFDVTILVDGSGSIDDQGWVNTVDFVESVTSLFDLGNEKTRVTLAQYSFDMKYYTRFAPWPRMLAKKVDELRGDQMKSSTMTNVALNGIMQNMKVYGRKDVPQIVILMTDGESSRGLTYPWDSHPSAYDTAAKLHDQGITTFVLAIGDETSTAENERIASTPTDDYLIPVSNFDALDQVNLQITKMACGMSRNGDRLRSPKFSAEERDTSGAPEMVESSAFGFEIIEGED